MTGQVRTPRTLSIAWIVLLVVFALVTIQCSPSAPAPQVAAPTTAAPAPTEVAPTSAPPAPPTATMAAGPQKGGRVIVGVSQEITTLNPLSPNNDISRGIEYSIFDALWRIYPDGTFVPNLATEIPTIENGGIAKDGMSYTFRLKQGVKWHDGEPFTAKDVKFTWETIMNPSFRAQSQVGYDSIESIETPDDYTVVIKMKAPFAPFLVTWSDTYIVPEHILSKAEDLNMAPFNTAPIGTGAFMFSEWVAGSHETLKANPNYHGTGPYLDEIIFKLIPDLTQLYTQFKTGEIDVVGLQGIPNNYLEEAKQLPDRKVVLKAKMATEQLLWNYISPNAPFLAELPVRQALYLAIDKQPIIEGIRLGADIPAETFVPPASWAYNPDVEKHEYNPDKAKQILDEAGWKVGPDGIRVKDGVRLAFDFSTTTGNKLREEAQQVIQQQWREIGVEARINNMASATLFGDYERLSQFDVMLCSITLGPDPDYSNRLHCDRIPVKSPTKSGQNYGGYCNEEMSKLFDMGAVEPDQAKRKEIYGRIQELFVEDLPFLPLFHPVDITGTKAKLHGYTPNSYLQADVWNTFEWYWES